MTVEGVGRGNVVPIELLRRNRAQREQRQAAAGPAADGQAGDDSGSAAANASGLDRTADVPHPDATAPSPALERARLLDRYRAETAGLPDVRRDKVIEAKLRISTGYYNRDDIRREVLRSVLEQLLPAQPPAEGPSAPPSRVPAATAGSDPLPPEEK